MSSARDRNGKCAGSQASKRKMEEGLRKKQSSHMQVHARVHACMYIHTYMYVYIYIYLYLYIYLSICAIHVYILDVTVHVCH